MVVDTPANALLDRHNNAATEESLEALYWARDKGHALLLIFSFEADIHTRLNFHADSLAGLASLLPGPGAIFDLHHWLSSEGIAGAEARQLIVPRRAKLSPKAKKRRLYWGVRLPRQKFFPPSLRLSFARSPLITTQVENINTIKFFF